jgi:hypothetical protein
MLTRRKREAGIIVAAFQKRTRAKYNSDERSNAERESR